MTLKRLLSSSIILAGFPLFAEEPGSLTGQVVCPQRDPIVMANVALTSERGEAAGAVRADTEGRFTLSGLTAGLYSIKVSNEGFKPKTVGQIQVRPGETTRLSRIVLDIEFSESCPPCTPTPPPGMKFETTSFRSVVEGRVIRVDGTPLRGVTITVWSQGANVQTVRTGRDGTFAVVDLDPGTYDIWAKHPRFYDNRILYIEVRRGTRTAILNRLVMEPCPTDEPCVIVWPMECPYICMD